MTRHDIFQDMEETIGVVPSFFKSLPANSLEQEWQLFKRTQLEPGAVPNKYRELIGLGIAAVTKCKYCIFFHTEMARANGATEAEIEDAVHFAKSSAGWSAYLSGMQTDFEQFKSEVRHACEHARNTTNIHVPPEVYAVTFDEPTELGD